MLGGPADRMPTRGTFVGAWALTVEATVSIKTATATYSLIGEFLPKMAGGTDIVLSRGGLQENSFEGPGYVDGEETSSGITVVFAAFVDDPEIPMPLRLLIGDHSVQLANLERRLVALVFDAHREPCPCFGWSFHSLSPAAGT
jgi:hypothetical protein